MIEPYYTTMSRADLSVLADLIRTYGYAPVIAGIADIQTQAGDGLGSVAQLNLSLILGGATAEGQKVDKEKQADGSRHG